MGNKASGVLALLFFSGGESHSQRVSGSKTNQAQRPAHRGLPMTGMSQRSYIVSSEMSHLPVSSLHSCCMYDLYREIALVG